LIITKLHSIFQVVESEEEAITLAKKQIDVATKKAS
jgi:hypothetical protein